MNIPTPAIRLASIPFVEVVESVLSRHIDDLEPTPTRHGYRIKDLMEQLDAKSADIKALFNNTLDPMRQ